MEGIYLDNNATTPVDPRVIEAMIPALTTQFGNPSSATHRWGWEAETLVDIAREHIARLIACQPGEIIFTSGATESITTVLQSCAKRSAVRILYSSIEHKAVLDNVLNLQSCGLPIQEISVDETGLLNLNQLQRELQKGAALTCIIGANNEIGVVQPLQEIGALCQKYGSLLHFDLVQAAGKIPLNCSSFPWDFISLSAHKIYGPKGCGALIIRDRSQLQPLIRGGGQERGLRSGTLNVPGIVGFGRAAEILHLEFSAVFNHIQALTEKLSNRLSAEIPGLRLNGSVTSRIPGNLNLQLPGIKSDRLIAKLASRLALSSSSACLSGDKSASHVLRAIGLNQGQRECSLRIGIGRFNSTQEIESAADLIIETYRTLL